MARLVRNPLSKHPSIIRKKREIECRVGEEWLRYHRSVFAGTSELEGVINLQDKGSNTLPLR